MVAPPKTARPDREAAEESFQVKLAEDYSEIAGSSSNSNNRNSNKNGNDNRR